MIRCNLAIILAEHNLKITQVSKDTSISRTTLTSLANNHSQGIQFETLNTLCTYLNVTPLQLISHIPINFSVSEVTAKNEVFDVTLTISTSLKNLDCVFTCRHEVTGLFSNNVMFSGIFEIILSEAQTNQHDLDSIVSLFRQVPATFLIDLGIYMINSINDKFPNNSISSSLTIYWDNRFNPN